MTHRYLKDMPPIRAASGRRRILACAGAGFLVGLGCGRARDPAQARGSTVTVAYCCGAEALNPIHDMDAKFLVFLPLMSHRPDGTLEGRLARSWEHSPDYGEWTYHLRTDVRWHDGAPVTAHDIKFTVDVMRSFDDLDYGLGAIESVTVHNDSTVTIRSGHSRFYQTWMVYYPKHMLERLDPAQLAEWDFWARPVGNGPYRFVRYVPETMMEFEANPDYYGGKPRIDRVVLKFSRDAGLTELTSGNVDAITDIAKAHVLRLSRDPHFRVYYRPWAHVGLAVYWRNDHPLFGDAAVRRALTLAIDRRELLNLLNLPSDLPIADGPYTPRQFYSRDLPAPLPHDPARARTLLEASGWRDQDGDGVRERDGRPFRFTALVRTFSSENAPGLEETAVFVQDQLRRVGVRMDLQLLEPSVIFERLQAGDFEALFFWFRFYEASSLQFFRFGQGPPIGYRNPRLVSLIDQARTVWDPDREDALYQEMMEIFRADLPVAPLHPHGTFSAAHQRLRGLSSPWRSDPVEHMEDLWIEEEQ